jgi:hypothetical protein
MHPQAVVESDDLANGFRGQTFEESPQSGLVRKLREPEHFQEGPVVLKDFGLVDAPHAHDDGEHKCQGKFHRMECRLSLTELNMPLEKTPNVELFAKTLDQPHSAEVRNMCFSEGEMIFLGTFGHVTQSTPFGVLVS